MRFGVLILDAWQPGADSRLVLHHFHRTVSGEDDGQ